MWYLSNIITLGFVLFINAASISLKKPSIGFDESMQLQQMISFLAVKKERLVTE